MEKIITTIVSQLLSKLTKDRKYYTQKELSDYGYPQFLIKRITFHLVRELRSEFNLPGEEWLNRNSDELLVEWADLQRTIKREIQLPAFLAKEMVEKSVRECVGMTIQPRKVIPELLFEDHAELDSNLLTERSSAITVNRFLVWSMVRYMEKKNKESLNIKDASRILESIENKIVEGYHPLNWLSLVKPLYELSGSTVHSDLFRRFFEYKGKNHLAKEFDLIDDEIKESRFIEILSSPRSIHVEGYKDDQQNLFQEEDKKEHKEDVIETEESTEDLIEDLSDNTPIFQSFRENPVTEPDEWDDEEEQVSELEEAEDDEEQISESEGDEEKEKALDPEEDQVSALEVDDEEELLSDPEEDVEEERISDLEEDDDEEEQESESEEDDDDDEEQESESEEDDDDYEEQESESEEDVEEERISDLEEDDEEEQVSAPEVADEVEQVSDPEEDEEVNIQDEELRAPWEEEEEDSFTFITHDDSEDEQEVFDEHHETSKSDEPVSDAALLEIEDEEGSSLLNRFMFDDSDTEDSLGSIQSDGNKKVPTIYDELNLVRNDAKPKTMDLFGTLDTPETGEKTARLEPDDESLDSENEESDIIRKFSDLEESESEKNSDDTEVPMWRSFLEREENEAKSVFQFDDETTGDEEGSDIEDTDEKLDEDGFIEEPIYDFTKKEIDLDEKIGDLSNWMKDVREKFIEELFGDSEDAYEQALSDIMEFDNWKNASKYIEKEIFTRNRIDIYDEIAVDFTDRLHSYFIENKS